MLVGALDVAHEPQRRAQHVADAERHRARVQRREVAVEQVLDDRLLAGREDLLGNLAARLERPARQRDLAARPRQLELERAAPASASMMKPRSAPVTSMRRVEHERQHLVEHAARPERAQPFEQRAIWRRSPAAAAGDRGSPGRSSFEETTSAAPIAAELDAVAVLEHALGRRARR